MGGLPAPFFYFDRNFRSISKTTQFYSHPSYSRYGAAIFISVPNQRRDSGKVAPHSHTLAQPIKRDVGSCESHLVSSYLGKTEAQQPVQQNQPRVRGSYGKSQPRRGAIRSNAVSHIRMKPATRGERTHAGTGTLPKPQWIHARGFNLSLILQKQMGAGTPTRLAATSQGRVPDCTAALAENQLLTPRTVIPPLGRVRTGHDRIPPSLWTASVIALMSAAGIFCLRDT